MRILIWHVHGSWTTAFVAGEHEYLIPVSDPPGPDGRGLATTWDWDRARQVPLDRLAEAEPDLVVLQRPHELELVRRHLGREPGRDLPAVYVEHNTPRGDPGEARHPLADQDAVPVVHVTHFNQVFWDCGRAPTRVIEHGIPDPGHRYTGELARVGVVVNEPVRRWRITGTDLLPRFARLAPLDVFGMRVDRLPVRLAEEGLDPDRVTAHEDPPQSRMHAELARRRLYLHPIRWTSLGLSLLEAMQLGMPVVALATTEAVEAVPPGAGVVSTRLDVLETAVRDLLADADAARETGAAARAAALARYGLDRFLDDWDLLIKEVTG